MYFLASLKLAVIEIYIWMKKVKKKYKKWLEKCVLNLYCSFSGISVDEWGEAFGIFYNYIYWG